MKLKSFALALCDNKKGETMVTLGGVAGDTINNIQVVSSEKTLLDFERAIHVRSVFDNVMKSVAKGINPVISSSSSVSMVCGFLADKSTEKYKEGLKSAYPSLNLGEAGDEMTFSAESHLHTCLRQLFCRSKIGKENKFNKNLNCLPFVLINESKSSLAEPLCSDLQSNFSQAKSFVRDGNINAINFFKEMAFNDGFETASFEPDIEQVRFVQFGSAHESIDHMRFDYLNWHPDFKNSFIQGLYAVYTDEPIHPICVKTPRDFQAVETKAAFPFVGISATLVAGEISKLKSIQLNKAPQSFHVDALNPLSLVTKRRNLIEEKL